jgi:hypothetical protein
LDVGSEGGGESVLLRTLVAAFGVRTAGLSHARL